MNIDNSNAVELNTVGISIDDLMFSLLRLELFGETADSEKTEKMDSDTLSKLFSLSDKHDLSHIIAEALSKIGKLGNGEISEKFKQKTKMAYYRYNRTDCEIANISETLEKAQIPFVLLKGAVIRDLYPEPWLRTSCDIDVLVSDEDVEKASAVLQKELNYIFEGKKSFHDFALFSQSGVHVELHFDICEYDETMDGVLSRVWDYAVPVNGKEYCCELTNEFLLFYHIAHMAHHFLKGGCGVRPFVDLELMENKLSFDENELSALLKESNLAEFYCKAKEIIEIWLNGAEKTEETEKIRQFVLNGGVYGSLRNRVTLLQVERNGKFKNFILRIFLPYKSLVLLYPFLKKHRWLMPFCEVHRWFMLLFGGKVKSSLNELRVNADVSDEESEEVRDMLKRAGLR